jgi:hypothetical protein
MDLPGFAPSLSEGPFPTYIAGKDNRLRDPMIFLTNPIESWIGKLGV